METTVPIMNMPILIIADDLTGAADTAVQFRQAGFSALVLARPVGGHGASRRAQVVSLTLDTRDATPAAVRRLWQRHQLTIRALSQGALVYHKIDSTLRGHPGQEVRLLLDQLGAKAAVIAPAFPKLGRQTIDGVHRVHGVPLAETEYARAQRRARPTSFLPELFGAGGEQAPAHLPLQVIDAGAEAVLDWLRPHLDGPTRLITADAADERHLDVLTRVVLPHAGRLLLVGSAGWAERLALACKARLAGAPWRPGVLAVVGSLSSVATRQVRAAAQAGVRLVQCPLTSTPSVSGEAAQDWESVAQRLASGGAAILWSNPGDLNTPSRRAGRRVLRDVAAAARAIMATTLVGGLAIVGGDTARAVFHALRASGLELAGEVTPGLPYGRLLGGPHAGLLTATKAGGFGSDQTLYDCLMFLQGEAT